MNKNCMSGVANLLGLELDKEFNIKGSDYNPYKITDKGLVDCEGEARDLLLMELLKGNHEIIKKPWKPSTGDSYYYIEATLDCNHIDVWQEIWKNTTLDMERYAVGNFFKTRGEASNNVDVYCKHLNNVVADLSWHNNK